MAESVESPTAEGCNGLCRSGEQQDMIKHLERIADVLGPEGCAGYGVKGGQPLEASKGVQAANPKS